MFWLRRFAEINHTKGFLGYEKLLVLLMALVVVLAACGGNKKDDKTVTVG